MFFRGIFEELMWFIKGNTDSNVLKQKNVHIWDKQGSKENLLKLGFKDRQEGDLGPIYGFQWRHFGAEYTTCNDNYNQKGFDQLSNCIDMIKNDPTSRRIIINAWNPNDISRSALPPCHVLYQFFVRDGTLSCQMYQRSGDIGMYY